MSGIFISYRRSGASVTTYRLADELKRTFGDKAIFLDVESIQPGLPFAEAIQQSLNQCSVALIMMGSEWATMSDESGQRRLDDAKDWVRQEVRLALASRAIRVIPVLVQNAQMPEKASLPDDIQSLADLHAFSLSNSQTHWGFDVKRLIDKIADIDSALAKKIKPGPKVRSEKQTGYSYKAIASVVIGVIFGLSLISGDIIDYDTAFSAVFMFSLGIGLGFWAYRDITQGKTQGKKIAIGGMITCGLFLLAAIGNLAKFMEEDDYIQPAVVNPITPPNQSVTVNLSGLWIAATGYRYQMIQSGQQVTFTAYSPLNVVTGTGQGNIQGNQLYFDYYTPAVGQTGSGVASIKGNTLSINFTDFSGNQEIFDVYRQ